MHRVGYRGRGNERRASRHMLRWLRGGGGWCGRVDCLAIVSGRCGGGVEQRRAQRLRGSEGVGSRRALHCKATGTRSVIALMGDDGIVVRKACGWGGGHGTAEQRRSNERTIVIRVHGSLNDERPPVD